jgi:hypothetical protein
LWIRREEDETWKPPTEDSEEAVDTTESSSEVHGQVQQIEEAK